MSALIRTFRFLIRARLRSPLFYVLLVVALLCSVLPLAAGPSAGLAAAICDRDNTALSHGLVREAMGIPTLRLEECAPERLPDALAKLRNGRLEAVFVVEKGYENGIGAGKYDNAVRLYLSPYSTSARTLSDGVAALVLRQWLKERVADIAAEAINSAAGEEAAHRFEDGSKPIILLDVEGEPGVDKTEHPAERNAQSALRILACLACFLILCFPESSGQNESAVLERFVSMGWHPYVCFFTRTSLRTVPAAIAAIVPCVVAVPAVGAGRLDIYPLFLLYLFAWVGVASFLDAFIHNCSVRLTGGLMISIINAVLLFPNGLSEMMGPARGIFAGFWFSNAFQSGPLSTLLPLGIYTAAGVAAGVLWVSFRQRRI